MQYSHVPHAASRAGHSEERWPDMRDGARLRPPPHPQSRTTLTTPGARPPAIYLSARTAARNSRSMPRASPPLGKTPCTCSTEPAHEQGRFIIIHKGGLQSYGAVLLNTRFCWLRIAFSMRTGFYTTKKASNIFFAVVTCGVTL